MKPKKKALNSLIQKLFDWLIFIELMKWYAYFLIRISFRDKSKSTYFWQF